VAYRQWGSAYTSSFDQAWMDSVVARDAMPLVTWEPWVPAPDPDQPDYSLERIAQGYHDAYIRQFAQDAKAWGKPFYLRFAHEANGTYTPWGIGVNGNTSSDYVAAWRHIYKIFEWEGAINVRWVWCPGAGSSNGPPFYEFYPGDAYVDWVCMDGYNQGTSQSWSRWATFTEIFADGYDAVTAFTDKPVMIGEMASVEQGGDKAAWIRSAYLNEVPQRFPDIKAIVWFHEDKEADYRVNSSQAALDAYREVVSSPLYQGTAADQ
jgi:beta-mannanase